MLKQRMFMLAALCALLIGSAVFAAKPPATHHAGKGAGASASGAPRISMVVEGRGTVVMELFPKAAPKTVAHILTLVRKNFYDGIKVHRVEPGFVMQVGDPVTKKLTVDQFQDPANQVGSHGSGTTVPLEASLKHARGTLGLARSREPDSGDSQFFVNLSNNDNLDAQNPGYCVFGKVVSGMDVVDKMAIGDRIKSMRVVSAKGK